MLDAMGPLLTGIIEGDQNHKVNRLHFQQYGAPSHYDAAVKEVFKNRFPGQRIWRKGSIEWLRTSDFTPLYFLLMGFLIKIYAI